MQAIPESAVLAQKRECLSLFEGHLDGSPLPAMVGGLEACHSLLIVMAATDVFFQLLLMMLSCANSMTFQP